MIKLFLTDVDGVLTDGGVYISSSGEEIKKFHVRDGLMLVVSGNLGIKRGIISGRYSKSTELRATELGLDYVYNGVADKMAAFEEILDHSGVALSECAYMGDDVNDIKLLRSVGFSGTVSDAPEIVKQNVDMVVSACGGHGAVRLFLEEILKKDGKWEDFCELYL